MLHRNVIFPGAGGRRYQEFGPAPRLPVRHIHTAQYRKSRAEQILDTDEAAGHEAPGGLTGYQRDLERALPL